MRLLTLLLCLLPTTTHAQTWVDVLPPTTPLVSGFAPEQSQLSNHTWLYPFTQPTPAGTYEVSNAVIDKSQKLGAWSQPRTLVLQSGWFLHVGSWNQPVSGDEAGIAWKVKVVTATQFDYTPFTNGSEHYFYTGWSGQYVPNIVAPYSYSLPRLQEIKQDSRRLYRLDLLTPGGRHTTVAPAPVCVASNLPLTAMEIAWCRVTETGETALSPSFFFTPPTPNEGYTVAEVCELPFGLQEQQPQGVIGYHIYVKIGGIWQRVPAPHCYGTPATPDDWLFQWHDRQPTIVRIVPSAPTHNPVAQPQSRLNTLQLKLRNTYGNIQISPNAVCKAYCPVIDEWRVGPWPFITPTFGRRISSSDGGRWVLRQHTSMSGHKYWPVLAIENSYSQWDGVEVQATGGSAALSFVGDGGQAFGNRFTNCNFYADDSPTGVTTAILIDAKSTGQYGSHTASEQKFYNTKARGKIVAWVGGNQTANVIFNESNFTSTGADRASSVVYLECPNQVVFTNGFNADCRYGSAIFRAAEYNAKLLVSGIWVDQECACFIECCGVGIDARFDAGKVNVRGTSPLIARLVCQYSPSKFVFNDVDIQPDPGVTKAEVVNGNYNMVEVRTTDTYLSELTVLREPTKEQTTSLLRTIQYDPSAVALDVQLPGMRLELPPAVAPVGFVGPIQGESIVFNSLTGRQYVRRVEWTE